MNPRIRLILLALLLGGAVWALWPTWQYSQINAEREALVEAYQADSSEEARLALARWDSLNYDDWLSAREGRIKLGLDLRGGVYFTMEVDVPALLYESADEDLIDDTFEDVIAAVREEAATSDDPVIEIFEEKFNEIGRPAGKTLLDYYDFDLDEASDEAILEKLATNITDAVDQAEEVIRQRVNKDGLTEPSIQQLGSRRIVVELPDEKDPDRVRDLLSRTARLEFKLVRNDAETIRFFKEIDELLSDIEPEETTDDVDTPDADTTGTPAPASDTAVPPTNGDTNATPADTTGDTVNDPYAGLSEDEQAKKYLALHPFTSNLFAYYQQAYEAPQEQAQGVFDMPSPPEGEYTFVTSPEGMAKIREILSRPEVRALIPEDRQIAFSPYQMDPEDPDSPYEMFVLKADEEMTGETITDANPSTDPMTGRPVVQMAMNLAGAETWSDVTGENVHKRVAVVLDSSVYSAPWIQGQISGGQTQITGSSDAGEANLLAIVLKSGALKAPIKIIEERIVGPSLGADQIQRGINAILFAALLVILFMAIYYATGGVVADLAVGLNVLFTLAFLGALRGGATLTLPGIGALVVTIGMAVDANILIYERIREELAFGKPLKMAVQLGYEKAFSAIIDSNITTFITGVILFAFGSGPIKGFAVMLMIGIAATLFTAVFVTRAIFEFMLERGAKKINFGQPKQRTA